MKKLTALCALVLATLAAASAASAAQQARETGTTAKDVTPACTTPAPEHVYTYYHCYTPQQMRAAYGVDALGTSGLLGQGQTIVLVDSYGSPTATTDLQKFHDTFFSSLPNPSFEEVYPQGKPDYQNANGNGQSGSSGAAGWSGEATLDIEWSYAMAPLAHIVLLAVPPAETEGVQGFPNLFNAIRGAIDTYPAGTIFSMSFGVTEQTFEGAYGKQTSRFDSVFQYGINTKHDTFFASSGDDGTLGVAKQHRETATYPYATVGWPASSPYVTSVGGTQLQYGWTWNPQSDIAFNADGSFNAPYWQTTSGGNLNVVWNESWLPAATGGGPSQIYSRPSWQNVLTNQGDHRLIPDLSWDAAVNGGALVYITAFPDAQRAGWHVYGGTSSASPQVAGLTALAEQAAGHPLGNINAAIYAHPGAFTDVAGLHQGAAGVISGDLSTNRMFDYNGDGLPVTLDAVTGWDTTTGYDMTTGFGTPIASSYVAALG